MNLLQPQDRRSRQPGDSAEAVAARRRLHERGVTAPLLAGIADLLGVLAGDTILDAGCGEGFYLGNLQQQAQCEAWGVDISIPAVDSAARKYVSCSWLVANADREIPCKDAAFSVVMSITARMNPGEFRRVLRPDGRLLVAIPAPDDLIELRGAGKERAERTLETFSGAFVPVAKRRISTTALLDEDAVRDVLLSIYRPLQSKAPVAQPVTFSLDLLLLQPR